MRRSEPSLTGFAVRELWDSRNRGKARAARRGGAQVKIKTERGKCRFPVRLRTLFLVHLYTIHERGGFKYQVRQPGRQQSLAWRSFQ
jgi:hypothetical protein